MYYKQQGDVLLIREDNPEILKKVIEQGESINKKGDRVILAEGEATGHAHAMPASKACLYQLGAVMYLHVMKACMLEHEEHKQFKVNPGLYQVGQIREINPLDKQVRAVQD